MIAGKKIQSHAGERAQVTEKLKKSFFVAHVIGYPTKNWRNHNHYTQSKCVNESIYVLIFKRSAQKLNCISGEIFIGIMCGDVIIKIGKNSRSNNQWKHRIGPIVKSPGPDGSLIIYLNRKTLLQNIGCYNLRWKWFKSILIFDDFKFYPSVFSPPDIGIVICDGHSAAKTFKIHFVLNAFFYKVFKHFSCPELADALIFKT